jgi:hypothetical protein
MSDQGQCFLDIYSGKLKSLKGKHIPNCEYEDAPLEFCSCACTSPVRNILIHNYLLNFIDEIGTKENYGTIKARI